MSKNISVFAEDMSEEHMTLAIETAQDAFMLTITQGKVYSKIAEVIRSTFEKQDSKGWNCVVGSSFGAYVTHKIKTFIYFQVVPNVSILLWKGGE
mmetsp:Transcript_60065/g.82257  ORF Transcript_60065/g.82257 Transcript_60065/m.82257 type:complete len:95 (+) Transcript_60065:47-331(+)